MNARLLARREKLLSLMARGKRLFEAEVELTKDLKDLEMIEKERRAIRKDWARRLDWMDQVARIKDPSFLTELVAGMDEATRAAWQVFEECKPKDKNAKVGAIRTAIRGRATMAAVLMKAGVIKEAPTQIESTITLSGTPFDKEPDMKKVLLEEAERQRLAKQAEEKAKNANQ